MFEEPIYPFQASFSKGEVSPDLHGRIDLQAYASGLKTSRNAFVRTEGSWSNRPGSAYCGNALTNTPNGSILIPFTFNVGQSYVIEIGAGPNGVQVWAQGALVQNVSAPAAITNIVASPGLHVVVLNITAANAFAINNTVTISGVNDTGTVTANGVFNVVAASPTQFTIIIPITSAYTYTYISGGTATAPIYLTAPYTQSELQQVRWAQSADTLTLCHQNHPPYEFKRTSATSFTLQPAVYMAGPFNPTNSDGVTLVYASSNSGGVTLTATSPIFSPNHVGGLFFMEQQDLSPVLPWEPTKIMAATGFTAIGIRCRSNLKNYVCVAGGSQGSATGTIAPSHSQGTEWDGTGSVIAGFSASCGLAWEFTDPGWGVVLITGVAGTPVNGLYPQATGTVQPLITGQTSYLPATVVGGPLQSGNVATTWGFTGTGAAVNFGPLTGNTTTDPNKFYVTVGGVYIPPTNYVIIGVPNGAIQFNFTPALGAPISVNQFVWTSGGTGSTTTVATSGGLFATTFWAFGAFSAQNGYPATCTYFPDRLILAGTTSQPVGVFASQTSVYHNFAYSTPGVNSDAFTVFLNARQLNTITDIIPLQDVIVGTANIMWRLWPGSTGTALGPEAIDATPQVFTGQHNGCRAVLYGDSMIYPIYGGRRIRDMLYQFQFDKYVGSELTAYSRHLFPYGTTVTEMMYAPDPWGQLFALRSDGQLNVCTYVREQQMIAWSRWDTGNGAASIDDIAIVQEGNVYSLYWSANRIINGVNARYVERLSNWEAQTQYDWKFMDCSLTYDGRNQTQVTMKLSGGTTWISGDVGTLNASTSVGWVGFAAADPTNLNQIQLFDPSGNMCRVLITGYVSATQVSVRFIDPIPADLQSTSTLTWTFARTSFGGVQQLANQTVAVIADGNALCGRNGVPNIVVSNAGVVTLPNACGVVTVGLPYYSDFETLTLNKAGQDVVRERARAHPGVYLDVNYSRGLLAGTDFVNMTGFKQRQNEPYLSPQQPSTGIIRTIIQSEFDAETHICIRQPYPLPVTIRMVIAPTDVGEPII